VKIAWNTQSDLTAAMTVGGMADMRLAEYNTGTSKWTMVGTAATAITSGTLSDGDVSSSTSISANSTPKLYTTACESLPRPSARLSSATAICGTAGIPVVFTSYFPITLNYSLNYTIDGVAQTPVSVNSLPYLLPTTTPGAYQLTGFKYNGSVTSGIVETDIVNAYALPTTASAGTDQSLCGVSGTTLAANNPTTGIGAWSVVSGAGGNFFNNLLRTSTFTGILGNTYQLKWTISNYTCKSESLVNVSFPVAATLPSNFVVAPLVVCQTSTLNTYKVNSVSGASYAWTYSGSGVTINGGSSNLVTLDFNTSATAGNLTVVASNSCGTSLPRSVSITPKPRGNWLGSVSTDWANVNNWSCPSLPNSSTDVTIASTAPKFPIVANAAICKNLTLGLGCTFDIISGGSLDVFGNWANSGTFTQAAGTNINFKGTSTLSGSSTNTFQNVNITGTLTAPATNLIIQGNWTNNGTFNHGNGTLVFAGSTTQNFGGSASLQTLNNLKLNAGSKVSVSSNSRITAQGTTTLAGALTLKSDASSTASFIDNGIAQTSSATVQRYIPDGFWHYIGLPVDAVQRSQFKADYFFGYNETILDNWNDTAFISSSEGWFNPSDGLLPANYGEIQGYALIYAQGTHNFVGKLNTGNYSRTLRYTNSSLGDKFDGWNLVGNPYPSYLDWDLVDKTNIDKAIFYYEDKTEGKPNQGNYRYYIGSGDPLYYGISLNGGSRFVPPGQGFFVRTGTDLSSLPLFNSNRSHSTQNFYKKSGLRPVSDLIQLEISQNDNADETAIYTTQDATGEYDANFDAYKFFARSELPQIFTTTKKGSTMAINAYPEFNTKTVIPLGLFVPESGEVYLQLTSFNPQSISALYLYDKLLGKYQSLWDKETLSLTLDKGSYLGRFMLTFSKEPTDLPNFGNELAVVYSHIRTVMVTLPPAENAQGKIRLISITGRILGTYPINNQFYFEIPVPNYFGVLNVQVEVNDQIKNYKVIIQ
jgi:hypothetical protein